MNLTRTRPRAGPIALRGANRAGGGDNGSPPPAGHACDVCGRSFTSKGGLSLHRLRAHPAEYNREIVVERAKARWPDEEVRVMARLEAEATVEGHVRFMNQHLVRLMPGRTLEAVKGRRRDPAYRDLVREFCRQARLGITGAAPPPDEPGALPAERPDPANRDLLQTIDGLAREIDWEALGRRGDSLRTLIDGHRRQDITAPLMQWIRGILPRVETARGDRNTRGAVRDEPNISRRNRRRREFRLTQELYRKNQRECARQVLDGTVASREMLASDEDFYQYWQGVIEAPNHENVAPVEVAEPAQVHDHLWRPITSEEVGRSLVASGKAPGPDGTLPRDWNKIQRPIIAILFNLFMASGSLPVELHASRTIFIPKRIEEDRGLYPSEYRPLSIPSVIVRHFHKVLGARLAGTEGLLSDEQRAFRRKVDGIAENLCVLNTILREARLHTKTVHLGTLDVSKAFDTVSHEGLYAACRSAGIPEPMIEYIKSVYGGAYTTLVSPSGRNINEQRVKPTRGVRQGDPLSPILFSLVIDRVLETLNRDVGFVANGERVSWLAFADDVVLCATSQVGFQNNLDKIATGLSRYGLGLNAAKCRVLSEVASGRDKKLKIVDTPLFKVNGERIRQCAILDLWSYLGVKFVGSRVEGVRISLGAELERLSRAPLRPQQRLQILRSYLLPRHLFSWVLGRVTLGYLKRLDVTIRHAVRKWLHLPKDVTTGYFHAPVKSGGLGIPQMSEYIPHLRLKRLLALKESPVAHVRACAGGAFVDREVNWCRARLALIPRPELASSLRSHWARLLHGSVDGASLKAVGGSDLSSDWMRSGDRIPGADYVHYHWVRANALACAMRCSRGRRNGRPAALCRAGCRETETAGHIVQKCTRTHGGRILRHNAIVKTVADSLTDKGWTVHLERVYNTRVGPRKPDITACKDGRIAIIDAQVVSANDLDRAHTAKVAKYRDEADLGAVLLEEYGGVRAGTRRRAPTSITFHSVTVSWRGVWSGASVRDLLNLGVGRGTLSQVLTKAMKGSYLNWVRWNTMT